MTLRKQKNSKKKKNSKKQKEYIDTIYNLLDNCTKFDKNIRKKVKENSDFSGMFKQILLRPYINSPTTHFTCRLCRTQLGNQHKRRQRELAGDCYLRTLRKTPQLWIYRRWPSFYPTYLDTRIHCRNIKHLVMFLLGFLFWIPCFIFIEICKCFLCCCCSD